MKVLHVGIFKDHELGGDIVLAKGLVQNGCEVEKFDYRTLVSIIGVRKMLGQLVDRACGKDLLFIGKARSLCSGKAQQSRSNHRHA